MQIIKTSLKLWLFLMTMIMTSFPADAQQLRKVPVGIPAIGISSGSFIVAKEAGFYREEGFRCRVGGDARGARDTGIDRRYRSVCQLRRRRHATDS